MSSLLKPAGQREVENRETLEIGSSVCGARSIKLIEKFPVQAFRKAIGVRITEDTEVLEGEVRHCPLKTAVCNSETLPAENCCLQQIDHSIPDRTSPTGHKTCICLDKSRSKDPTLQQRPRTPSE